MTGNEDADKGTEVTKKRITDMSAEELSCLTDGEFLALARGEEMPAPERADLSDEDFVNAMRRNRGEEP